MKVIPDLSQIQKPKT